MKKIKLFSTRSTKCIEGSEANLYIDFYLVLDKKYIYTFLIRSTDLSCSDRHPVRLWKHFLIMKETELCKYIRRYEHMCK